MKTKYLERFFNVDGFNFKVSISQRNNVLFHIDLPYAYTYEANDSLWHDWDMPEEFPEHNWVSIYEKVEDKPIEVNIFKVITSAVNNIASLVNSYQLDNFYFSPDTEKKGRLYEQLAKRLIAKLNGDWSVQIIDRKWFYFVKK